MSDPDAPRGPDTADEERYVREVEERFRILRGTPLLVSPADFQRLISWHRRGVPLFLVLEALDHVFRRAAAEKPPRVPRSLAYCEAAVIEAFAEYRERQTGAPGPAHAAASRAPALADLVARAREGLARSAAPEAAKVAALEGLARLVEETRTPGVDAAAAIDAALVAACLSSLVEDERRALEEQARGDVAPFAAEMARAVLERAYRAALARRVRTRFALPDLTLLPLA